MWHEYIKWFTYVLGQAAWPKTTRKMPIAFTKSSVLSLCILRMFEDDSVSVPCFMFGCKGNQIKWKPLLMLSFRDWRIHVLQMTEECRAIFGHLHCILAKIASHSSQEWKLKIYLLIFNNLQDKIHFPHCVFPNRNLMKGRTKLFIGLSPIKLS